MTADERRRLVDLYREGPDVVEQAVAGLSDAELDRAAADGGWTARQVVHHLADSEMTSAIRLRRLIAEEAPAIAGYDEELLGRRLYYDRPIGPSLAALRAARGSTAAILERLEEGEWLRAGTHSESGAYSVETWLEIYASHAHDHAAQIGRALGR
jgi:hypothetical protein